jgi:hypothetical protein
MAEDCSEIPLENIEFCPSDEVNAGVSEVGVYAASVSEFSTIEKPPSLKVATDLESCATIEGAHAFVDETNGGFHKLQINPDSGMIETVQLGTKGNISFQNSFTFALRGTAAKVAGYARKYRNEPMIYIVKEKNGDVKQIGSQDSPAYMVELAAGSGQAPGDPKQSQFIIRDSQNYPAPEYAGTITEFTTA